MKSLTVHGRSGDSTIVIGASLDHLKHYVGDSRSIIITDKHVNAIYGHRFPVGPVIEIGVGESIKNLDTVRDIYAKLVDMEADRSTMIVGIGGGIVCDIAGFVASTYLRGVRFGFVSTTLLSQVDASVGGKNGVNFQGYKNMVGVFNQPEFVICDPEMLQTLPPEELKCGFAEIVKHAAIADPEYLEFLETHYEQALNLDPQTIETLVYKSVVIKSDIVNKDERESGERRKLNFGHTFGHAIEKTTGVRHGEAVSAGMVVACALSQARGMISSEDTQRLEAILQRLHLPIRIPFDKSKALDAIRKDKKRQGDHIHFVLLDAMGHAVLETIAISELETVLKNW